MNANSSIRNHSTKSSSSASSDASRIQELKVAKSELTSGNTSGEVYVRSSKGAAFLLTERIDVIKGIDDQAISSKHSA